MDYVTLVEGNAANQASYKAVLNGFAQLQAAAEGVYLRDTAQAELATESLTLAGNFQSGSSSDSLLNVDNSTFVLLNSLPPSLNTQNGSFTPEQKLAIDILQHDALALEQTYLTSNTLPLSNDASTVDLSLQAQLIAAGGSGLSLSDILSADKNNANAPANVVANLTSEQLGQLSAIFSPLAGGALSPALVQQTQANLYGAGFNPAQMNLSVLFFVLNYIAAQQTTQINARQYNETDDTPDVAPVEATVKVAAEDMAILA